MSVRLLRLSVFAPLATLALAACSDGPTQPPPPPPGGSAPQITAIAPATLLPGTPATISGANFDPTPAANQVTIGGVTATVTGGSATQLTVTVPCAPSGSVAVEVTRAGNKSAPFNHPVQGNPRTIARGQMALLSTPEELGCAEIASAGGLARYVVAVFNTASSPGSSAGFQLGGDVAAAADVVALPRLAVSTVPGGAPPALLTGEEEARRRADLAHHRLLEMNAEAYERLYARFAGDARMRPSLQRVAADPVPPPLTRTFRVANINAGGFCNSFYSVNATRVYYDGKLAIYQDDANPITTSHPSLGASMQGYYREIGDQFNADMEPILRANFGDVLRRDAVTDNNGVLVALFTATINNQIPGVAGFVVSCDQFPNDEGGTNPINSSSNFGEYFYAYVPTVEGTGYSSGLTPDSWYRTIRSTFIHEAKHVISQAARVANGAPTYEASWLEEGTARHSEELWARVSVYGVAWKGNTGYGSAADLNSVYCDVRPTTAGCLTNPRRPSVNMQRHFAAGGLYDFFGNPSGRSPFGRTEGDNGASFYATAWSLVRYAIDRYGASDEAFLTALTQAQTNGITNLAGQAGVTLERLLAGWALALYADDYPGLAGASADLQFPTWNLPDIYAGLKADFASSYPRPIPIAAEVLPFGPIPALGAVQVSGGGVKYYEISGTQTAGQTLRIRGVDGGPPPSSLRVAIARIE